MVIYREQQSPVEREEPTAGDWHAMLQSLREVHELALHFLILAFCHDFVHQRGSEASLKERGSGSVRMKRETGESLTSSEVMFPT